MVYLYIWARCEKSLARRESPQILRVSYARVYGTQLWRGRSLSNRARTAIDSILVQY